MGNKTAKKNWPKKYVSKLYPTILIIGFKRVDKLGFYSLGAITAFLMVVVIDLSHVLTNIFLLIF